ncbi:MAG: hypothetical protein IH986_11905 [Planctomycetes bacterium]|nr:hypothetical protein [Planctomycetota bacterium]
MAKQERAVRSELELVDVFFSLKCSRETLQRLFTVQVKQLFGPMQGQTLGQCSNFLGEIAYFIFDPLSAVGSEIRLAELIAFDLQLRF